MRCTIPALLTSLMLAIGAAPGVGAQAPADSQAMIEGPQAGPGEDGLGAMTVAEIMERFGVPGVSVAVIRDFRIHWAEGHGIADVETGRPVDTETMFQAASISKPVAAMGVLKAVQDGLFGLDDDINDILTSWHLDGGELTRDQPVTPRMLTSHTSASRSTRDCRQSSAISDRVIPRKMTPNSASRRIHGNRRIQEGRPSSERSAI